MNIKAGDLLEADLDKENGKLTFSLKKGIAEESKA
jgi:hypothetical protein